MQLHLLLTPEIAKTKPASCKVAMDFGQLKVMFENGQTKTGLHCVVEDSKENIINWLKPFDGFVLGNGVPAMEKFKIVHIPD